MRAEQRGENKIKFNDLKYTHYPDVIVNVLLELGHLLTTLSKEVFVTIDSSFVVHDLLQFESPVSSVCVSLRAMVKPVNISNTSLSSRLNRRQTIVFRRARIVLLSSH